MKTIIAGSRNFNDYELLKREVDKVHEIAPITEVVSGGARGADSMGEWWARQNGIALIIFPADWNRFGKAAGPIRNTQMANYAQMLIAFLAKDSKGTKDMIEKANRHNLIVKVINI